MGRKHHHADVKKVAIGSIVAGAAGYVAGVLTSPKSGKQNRLKVKRVAKKGKKVTEKELKSLQKELNAAVDSSKQATTKMTKKAQGEYGLLLAKVSNSKEKVTEAVSAIKEGKAEDKNLDKAVKDAKAALGHIQDFIKNK